MQEAVPLSFQALASPAYKVDSSWHMTFHWREKNSMISLCSTLSLPSPIAAWCIQYSAQYWANGKISLILCTGMSWSMCNRYAKQTVAIDDLAGISWKHTVKSFSSRFDVKYSLTWEVRQLKFHSNLLTVLIIPVFLSVDNDHQAWAVPRYLPWHRHPIFGVKSWHAFRVHGYCVNSLFN